MKKCEKQSCRNCIADILTYFFGTLGILYVAYIVYIFIMSFFSEKNIDNVLNVSFNLSDSFWGAVIGGLITLFVMWTTINDGKKNLKMTLNANEKLKKQEENHLLCQDVADLISKFIRILIQIYDHEEKQYNASQAITALETENSKLQKDIDNEVGAMQYDESNYHATRIELNREKLNLNHEKIKELSKQENIINKAIMFEIYYNLKIRLYDSETANELYLQMEKVLEKYCSNGIVYWNSFDDSRKKKELDNAIDEIIKKSKILMEEINNNEGK